MLPATSVLSCASASCVLAEDDKDEYIVKQTTPVDNVEHNNCIAVGNDGVWRPTTLPAITPYVSSYNVDEDRVTSNEITHNVNDYTSHNGNQQQVKSLPMNEAEEQAKEGYDRYWQTVSVISCFVSVMFNNALVSSYGVLYIYLKEPLAVTEYQLSWIGSLMSGFFGVTSLLASVLIERVGSRHTHLLGGLTLAFSVIVSSLTSNIHVLYVTLGLLSGVGSSLTFVASTVHVSRQFSRWRPLAIGTASIGGAVGSLTWPPLMSGLVEAFGWRGALLINGALFLHMLPGALFIKVSPKPTSVKGSTTSDSYKLHALSPWQKFREHLHVIKVPGFISFSVSYVITGLGVVSFPTFIPDYVMTSLPGQTPSEVSLVVSFIGAGNILGRALFSVLCMLSPNSALYLHLILTTVCGLTCFAVVLCQNMADFYVTGVFYGILYGGTSAVWCPMLIIMFDLDSLHRILGGLLLMQGIGTICGPPFQSYLADVMTRKDLIFYTTGAFFICSILTILPFLLKKQLVSRQSLWKACDIKVTGITNKGADLGSTNNFT
ncbi:monocarboxylate transporter 13-like isoform X2 [Haliotis rufescens]|uniref:monocarboxylate transporter 13-like isoform X2 n=1 Tax=Haliotis rufescens TaxID=6454 RepID=UPI00201E9011|nr:monocarboxylate transporter 13-like isoform X2 [Haliotis rufescens]